ncbi:hypothetical protein [Marinicellulosiphila megalodicopiae]|uniref:hypothetical protein n=1 Tax=Marinicellulosiphila megalodicopiae TaxID=2724896 RepID=UPI003BB1F8D2
MINVIKVLLVLILMQSCAMPQSRTISTKDINIEKISYSAEYEEVLESIYEIAKSKKWKVLHSGDALPDEEKSWDSNATYEISKKGTTTISQDYLAWNKIINLYDNPKQYIQLKTKTTAFSYGAEIFIAIYEPKNNTILVEVAAGSSQAVEKKKLDGYISFLVDELNIKYLNTDSTL